MAFISPDFGDVGGCANDVGEGVDSVRRSLPQVKFAFQPIVSTKTLAVHGFEALARTDDTGFASIIDILETLDDVHTLYDAEMALVGNAIDSFMQIEQLGQARLFCNLDSRIYEEASLTPGLVRNLTTSKRLPPNMLCLEVSERYQLRNWGNLVDLSRNLTDQGVQIALDDFGIGMSGLHLLLRVEPHYVKIDRSFVHNLAINERQQALVSKLCGLAHSLGFLTIAEGVESETDLRVARDLGCDFAQGFHIARPTTEISELRLEYTSASPRHSAARVQEQVLHHMHDGEPLKKGQTLLDVGRFFEANKGMMVAPVIDAEGKLCGAVDEDDFHTYQASDFGLALLANKASPPLLDPLVRRFPIADATGTVETILNSYVSSNSARGLLLANGQHYVGYLSNHGLMSLALAREVKIAQDMNPLTQIAGNVAIGQEIEQILGETGDASIAYFDFDNFKAFNDSYGFASGDRALLLFADLLRKLDRMPGVFVGHVGGDDFFISIERPPEQANDMIQRLRRQFAEDVSCLYSQEDREAGGIAMLDRYGQERFFPLLCASACVLHLPEKRCGLTVADVEYHLTTGKKEAKARKSGFWEKRLEI